MNNYLQTTKILDFQNPEIQQLIQQKQWSELSEFHKIGEVYDFVQNELVFGYNQSDELKASEILKDGYGQCNTKGTVFMALLRAINIPCRFHGFTIEKQLQKGAITGFAYWLAPKNIIHSWVEIYFNEQWVNLEGFILDKKYLNNVQKKFSNIKGDFSGYGIATTSLKNPKIDWKGENTYIQKEGINIDFGVFDDPDSFYQRNGSNLSGLKALVYKNIIRHQMNSNVQRIRNNNN